MRAPQQGRNFWDPPLAGCVVRDQNQWSEWAIDARSSEGCGWSVGLQAQGVELEEIMHRTFELPTGSGRIESAQEQLS